MKGFLFVKPIALDPEVTSMFSSVEGLWPSAITKPTYYLQML